MRREKGEKRNGEERMVKGEKGNGEWRMAKGERGNGELGMVKSEKESSLRCLLHLLDYRGEDGNDLVALVEQPFDVLGGSDSRSR